MTTITATAGDGVRIAIHDLGGKGAPVLLVHGVGLCGEVFLPLADALRERWRLFALDLRGHGRSERPNPPTFHWDPFVLDIQCALAMLDADRPIAIGHSLGATALLLTEASHPSSFSNLYCYEPPMFSLAAISTPAAHQRVADLAKRRATFASRQEARAHFCSRGMFANFVPEALDAYIRTGLVDNEDGTVSLVLKPEDEARLFAGVPADRFGELRTAACRVTIAYGTASTAPGMAFVETILEQLPHGAPDPLAGLGHFGPMDDPEVVAHSIIRTTESPVS